MVYHSLWEMMEKYISTNQKNQSSQFSSKIFFMMGKTAISTSKHPLYLLLILTSHKNNPTVALCYDKLFTKMGSLTVLTQILEKVFVEPSLHIGKILT